jgi:uncharacterized protein YbaP (TraB family)
MANHFIVKRNWLKVIRVLFILGFVLTGGAAVANQQSQAEATTKSCLWSVEAGDNTIYLLGSLHVLKNDAYPLAAAIEEAYASSRKVVFETDMTAIANPAVQQKMLALGRYPEGQTLDQHLSGKTRNLLKKKMTELGLPIQQFANVRPWLIALTLATFELQRLGYNPMYGIDMHFFSRAKEDEKELGFFEPVEYQIDLLGKMTNQNQESFLNQTLEELDIVAELAAEMTAYWESGDAENLYQLMNRSFNDHPAIRDRLLIQRNKNWTSQIEALMKENKNVLVIVGAGHLVGPDSVVDLLKKKGLSVKQK